MLFLQLRSGEYLTIGEDIAVQVFQETGDRIRVAVKAPRDMTILRGEVLERTGENRPDGLLKPKKPGSAKSSQSTSVSTG